MSEGDISIEKLQKRRLFVATPMFGGQCYGEYVGSLLNLYSLCMRLGIHVQCYFMTNESLITRARNYCVDEFLRSDCTHLMFIDADIAFRGDDVIALLGLSGEGTEFDIVGGPYPKKTISWEKIRRAVKRGLADDDPRVLERYVGDYAFNVTEDVKSFRINRPVEVLEAGTGFMMLRRDVLERWAAAYPEQSYRPDHARSKHFNASREITCFFDTVIDPETKRYLSEDFMFCQWSRKAGLRVWLCPWMETRHIGTYAYGGSLAAMAAIDAPPTSDTAEIGGPMRRP